MIRKFVDAVDTGASEIIIGGTGCATRDFLHVEDCAEGILLALEHYSGGDAINLGSGAEVPIHELARRIARITGYTGRIQWDRQLSRRHDAPRARRNPRAKGIRLSAPVAAWQTAC